MRAIIACGLMLAVSGCSDPVQDAKDELAIVEKNARSNAEICVAKRKVEDAYLKAKDAKGHGDAKLSADITCRLSEQSRSLGLSDEPRR